MFHLIENENLNQTEMSVSRPSLMNWEYTLAIPLHITLFTLCGLFQANKKLVRTL